MRGPFQTSRVRLAVVVWAVLVSQVLVYPGLDGLLVAVGAAGEIQAGMWFLLAEFGAFVAFAVVWGAASDALGRRTALVVAGALGAAASYLILTLLPTLGIGFGGALVVRAAGGAFSIGAFSLAITMLMDLSGGNGRNMGAAGIAIGLGAAFGSVVGGQLATIDPFGPIYAGAAMLAVGGLVVTTVDETATATSAGSPTGGFGTAINTLRARPALGVPYAFGFVDRLTAGFFSLVGVFYFGEVFGLDAAGVGIALAMFFLPFALLQYPLGSLSDRIGRFVPIVGGSIGYGLAIVGVGLAWRVEVAMGMMVVVGISGAFVAPATMALVTDLVEPSERGVAMGGFNVFGSLGFLSGFIIGGVVGSATDYLTAFLVVGGLEIGIALLALPAVRRLAAQKSTANKSTDQ